MNSSEGMSSGDDLQKKAQDQRVVVNNDVYLERIVSNFELSLKYSRDFVCTLSMQGRFIEVNMSLSSAFGYGIEDLIGTSFFDLVDPNDTLQVKTLFDQITAGHSNAVISTSCVLSSSAIVKIDWVVAFVDRAVDRIYVTGYNRSVKSILNGGSPISEARFQALVENGEGILTLFNTENKILYRSASSSRTNGYTDDEFRQLSDQDYYHPDYIDLVKEKVSESLLQPGIPIHLLFKVKHKKGHYIWLEGNITNLLQDDSIKGIVSNFTDVSQNMTVIESLRKERDKFAKIAATSTGLVYSMRYNEVGELFFSYASDAFFAVYGVSYYQIKDNTHEIFKLIHQDDLELLLLKIKTTKEQLVPLKMQYRYMHPTKGLVWHEVHSLPTVDEEGIVTCHGVINDITTSIQSKNKISKANRLYLFISQINQMIVRATNKEELFEEACNIAVNCGHFKMAWIGLVDEVQQKVVPVTIAGEDKNYHSIIKEISTDETKPEGRGPVGTAARTAAPAICNDIENDAIMEPWRTNALEREYLSLTSFPIFNFGKVIGVFSFYAANKNFFDAEEIVLLQEATGDVSFALELFIKDERRKTAELAIYESEKRYHTLTEVSPVGIFRTDATGYTTYVNSRWCEISGFTFQKALGNGWLDAVHPDDKIVLFEDWEKATTNEEISVSEYRFIKPDGTITWVMGQAIMERNSENQIVGYIGTITDITFRKLAEEEFKNMNKKMEAIIEAIPDLMFEVAADGTFYNYYSKRNDLLLALPEDFIGKNIHDVFPLDAANASMLAIKEAEELGISTGVQYKLQLPLGEFWFELSIAPMVGLDHEVTHFICLARDITKVKNSDQALLDSEKRYKRLLNNLEAGIVVHGATGIVLKCNSKATQLLGIYADNLVGKDLHEDDLQFINEDGSRMVVQDYPVSKILKSKKPINKFTMGRWNPNTGKVVWVLVSGYPSLDDSNEIIEVVISFIDISERKVMEIEIRAAKELAEAANKAKTDFLANMSHEIRTPLNGIIGFTDLLIKSKLNTLQLEYMSTVNQSANSLLHIVNDVLDFSKIESGKLELNSEKIDLFELTHQVVDLFKYIAIKKNIDLRLHLNDETPQFIEADGLRLKQILVNLLSNAVKFTQKGEVVLYLETVKSVDMNYYDITFSVKDTGIGVKVGNSTKIFSSFVQEDNSTSRKFGGTGLGLAISNQLLELMHSKLELESVYGQGSNFFFTIKLKKIKESKDLIMDTNSDVIIMNDLTQLHKLVGKKVLIVEDNNINMFLARTLVKRLLPNCTVQEAIDGEDAVVNFKNDTPDLILMDIQMPNKNGYEAATEIRALETNSRTPIVAVTAGILAGEKEKCFESGMDDYMPKPIIIADLERILFKWLIKD